MKIKSNLIFNTSILAAHAIPESSSGQVVVGSGVPDRLLIPAGATISLPDEEWAKFNTVGTQHSISIGNLTLIEAPAISAEDQEKSDVLLEASLREQMNGIVERRAEAEAAEAEAEAAAAEAEANKS